MPACRCSSAFPGSRRCPIAESRSSYNGLLVFVFVTASASLAAFAIHRFASRAVRRAPAWDCGFPNAGLATQYTADSFAQPIRRVFGAFVFRAREAGRHAAARRSAPGEVRGRDARSRLGVHLRPLAGGGEQPSADRLNRLQFLTIRQYLSLVFFALVVAAPGARAMAVIPALAVQGAQMLLVLLLAPLLTGFVRKVKARLLRRVGPPLIQPYRDLLPPAAQGGGARRQRLLAVPRHPLSHLRRHLGRRGAGADLRDRPAVQLVRRPHRDHRAARRRALLPGARRHGRRHRASAASARAAR